MRIRASSWELSTTDGNHQSPRSPIPSLPHSTDNNFITFAIEEKTQKSLGPRATLTTNYDH